MPPARWTELEFLPRNMTNGKDESMKVRSSNAMIRRPSKRVGRSKTGWATGLLLLLLRLGLSTEVEAQFNYTTDNNTITITGYTGAGGEVTVPGMINGLPVVAIGDWALSSRSSITGIILPNSLTQIGY